MRPCADVIECRLTPSRRYVHQTVEGLVEEGRTYYIVIASEVVEHVVEMESFVADCAAATKPGGMPFFAPPFFLLILCGKLLFGCPFRSRVVSGLHILSSPMRAREAWHRAAHRPFSSRWGSRW